MKNRGAKNYITRGGGFSLCLLVYLFIPVVASVYLTRIWGIEGNSIFSAAYSFYLFLLIISGLSVPYVLGRLIRSRISRNAIKDARSMQRRAFAYCIFTGAAFGAVMYFFAATLSKVLLKEVHGEISLQVLAIACVFGTLCSFFRGYFIGHQALFILGLSMVVEQIIAFGAGIACLKMFRAYGEKVAAILRNKDYITVFSVAGYMMGIVISFIITFLFLFIVYIATHGYFRRAYGKDAGRLREDSLTGGFSFLSSLMPYLGIMIMTVGRVFPEQLIYKFLSSLEVGENGFGEVGINWGIYLSQYRNIILIPVIIAIVMCRIPAGLMARQSFSQEGKKRRALTGDSLKAMVITVAPISVILGLGSDILLKLLYPKTSNELLMFLLKAGFVSVVFYVAALLFFALLWEDGRRVSCFLGILLPYIINLVLEIVLIKTTKMDIKAFALCDIIFSLMLVISGGLLSTGAGLLKRGIIRDYVPIIIAFASMSVVVFVLTRLLKGLAEKGPGLVIYAIIAVLGTLVFYIIALVCRGVGERELSYVPGGGIIIFFGRLIGFL